MKLLTLSLADFVVRILSILGIPILAVIFYKDIYEATPSRDPLVISFIAVFLNYFLFGILWPSVRKVSIVAQSLCLSSLLFYTSVYCWDQHGFFDAWKTSFIIYPFIGFLGTFLPTLFRISKQRSTGNQ